MSAAPWGIVCAAKRSADWQDRRSNRHNGDADAEYRRLSSKLSAINRVMVIDASGASGASKVRQSDNPQ